MPDSLYPFVAIEEKWQKFWLDHKTFRSPDPTGVSVADKKKLYVLDMFPYPSGAGLHVGHPEGYTATDIYCRYKRMRGFNVLHPMGWDAFGLPAEQYAIETGTHPAATTAKNIATFRKQIQRLGLSYDWDREVDTTDPEYFRWTQWIFLKLYEKGLAYMAEVPVWWCEALGSVLANEEVVDGKSERGGHPVVRRPMRQWMLKITAYADRLLEDLKLVDWPDSVKQMQKNWIGRSEGALVDFKISSASESEDVKVFTTRPDTLFGATYMVLSPEHTFVSKITTPEQKKTVEKYQSDAAKKSELERTELAKEKTGVFTGAYAVNPVNGEKITSSELKKEIVFRKRVDPSFQITPETLSNQIDVMVYRRLLIQEAMRRGLAERDTFVNTLKNFWEQTLIKELMDEITREMDPSLSAEERSAAFEKKLDEIKSHAKIKIVESKNVSKL